MNLSRAWKSHTPSEKFGPRAFYNSISAFTESFTRRPESSGDAHSTMHVFDRVRKFQTHPKNSHRVHYTIQMYLGSESFRPRQKKARPRTICHYFRGSESFRPCLERPDRVHSTISLLIGSESFRHHPTSSDHVHSVIQFSLGSEMFRPRPKSSPRAFYYSMLSNRGQSATQLLLGSESFRPCPKSSDRVHYEIQSLIGSERFRP